MPGYDNGGLTAFSAGYEPNAMGFLGDVLIQYSGRMVNTPALQMEWDTITGASRPQRM